MSRLHLQSLLKKLLGLFHVAIHMVVQGGIARENVEFAWVLSKGTRPHSTSSWVVTANIVEKVTQISERGHVLGVGVEGTSIHLLTYVTGVSKEN